MRIRMRETGEANREKQDGKRKWEKEDGKMHMGKAVRDSKNRYTQKLVVEFYRTTRTGKERREKKDSENRYKQNLVASRAAFPVSDFPHAFSCLPFPVCLFRSFLAISTFCLRHAFRTPARDFPLLSAPSNWMSAETGYPLKVAVDPSRSECWSLIIYKPPSGHSSLPILFPARTGLSATESLQMRARASQHTSTVTILGSPRNLL